MATKSKFVEHRSEPTDRRSWERTPVFVGDIAAHVDGFLPLVFVTGTLGDEHVEVVRAEQLRTAPGTWTGLESIQEGVRDGRLITYRSKREDLSPATDGILERYREVTG